MKKPMVSLQVIQSKVVEASSKAGNKSKKRTAKKIETSDDLVNSSSSSSTSATSSIRESLRKQGDALNLQTKMDTSSTVNPKEVVGCIKAEASSKKVLKAANDTSISEDELMEVWLVNCRSSPSYYSLVMAIIR